MLFSFLISYFSQHLSQCNANSDAKSNNCNADNNADRDDCNLPVLHLHRQSAFLLGRDHKVADIPEQQHYVELMEKDVVKFGFSTREYVLLNIRT